MNYRELFSDDEIVMTKKQYFVNKNNVCNSRGLNEYIKDPEEVPDKYIVYVGIDLSEINQRSRALGDYALTKILQGLRFSHIFHLYGGKYAIFCDNEEIRDKVISVVSRKRDGVVCYYSVVEIDNSRSFDDMINEAYDLMNEAKSNAMLDALSKGQSIGTIPEEFQETSTKKYNNTFIYDEFLVCPKGQFNDTKVYIFPLEFKKEDRVSILCVVSTEFKQRAFVGKEIKFGISGTIYNANARFTRDGQLDVVLFATNNESNNTERLVKGVGIPSNFGKKFGNSEVFPYKDERGNAHYVVVTGEKPVIYDTQDIEIDGVRHRVIWDDVAIEIY